MKKHGKRSTLITAIALALSLLCAGFVYGGELESWQIEAFLEEERSHLDAGDILMTVGSGITDDIFRQFLNDNYNTDEDDWLEQDEIAKVTNITLEDMDIASLKGIEHLTSLKELRCRELGITSLDLSSNTELVYLSCKCPRLENIDVKGCAKLEELECSGCALKELDLSANKALVRLLCDGNNLKTLDISACPRLCAAYLKGPYRDDPDSTYLVYNDSYVDMNTGKEIVNAGMLVDRSTEVICDISAEPPEILKQPESVTAKAGETVALTIEASEDAVSYKWEHYDAASESWTSAEEYGEGYDAPVFKVNVTSELNNSESYRCYVRNDIAGVYSDRVIITVSFSEELFTEADRSELNGLIAQAEALKEEDYTPESFAKVKEALAAAAALPGDAGQDDVNEVSSLIYSAVNVTLEKTEDSARAGLKKAIEEAKAFKEEEYTAESFKFVKDTIKEAEELPEDADQEAVEAAANALEIAVKGLKKLSDIEAETLEKVIEKAEKLDEGKYTESSLAILDAVLDNAKKALGSDDAEEIAKAAKALSAALDSLDEISPVPFTDVAKDDYFYDAVVWAFTADPQVTDGTTPTTFSPANTCTRAQVVTFLWRAMGQPEPETKADPFTDVAETDWFYKPVLWAVEKGITDGTTPTTFSPKSTCRNSHILTFIYRAVGEPNKTGQGTWWTDAYNWANFNSLLKGSYTGDYDINADCPRANVVYYLHQLVK
ncbi:MAG: S-layer homology domain-containing protein [Firmicutes bacterium]|nr:S-layer homology domain-containing protein [Bacillota bacterium]